MSSKKIGVSPITKKCFVGTLNKKGDQRLKKEPLEENNVDDFIIQYIMYNKPESREFNWGGKGAKITVKIELE